MKKIFSKLLQLWKDKILNKPMEQTDKILKKLIKEMEDRVASFEKNRNLNKEIDASYGYWDGKRSEAAFVVEKLNYILLNGIQE